MGNLFSYENPIMQALMKLGDLMILNFIYLGCCIPVFTIGAASAGLYTAMKVMQDPEDDTSLIAAFFRGFKAGFGKVTLAWGMMTLLTLLVCAAGYMGFFAYSRPAWICIVPVVIAAWYSAQIPAFHSRFGCTVWQLIRNVWFLIIAHPLRTLGVAILTWLPFGLLAYGIVFTGDIFAFMAMAPIWITLYFGTAWYFSYSFLKKPFEVLIEHFNKTQAETVEATAEEISNVEALPEDDENALPAVEDETASEPVEV